MKYKHFTPVDILTTLEKRRIVNFLYEHLDEYGDTKTSISNAIDYALNPYPMAGGFILIAEEKGKILGIVVMNQTGMKGYIPENILVYIAVHGEYRGKGIGKKLMNESYALRKRGYCACTWNLIILLNFFMKKLGLKINTLK